ncbi:MAG: hypothetical protein ACREN4_08435 [Candidatus Dormibacteria bacterium]
MEEGEPQDYQQEIAELQAQLAELVENEAETSVTEEYSTEIRILRALLQAARRLQEQVRLDRELQTQLLARGFQPGRFRDLYSFVYDRSLELSSSGRAYADEVSSTDFAALLRGE